MPGNISESAIIITFLVVMIGGVAASEGMSAKLAGLVGGSVLPETVTSGDFNGDGRSDYAAVVRTGDFEMQKLLITAGGPDNTQRVQLLEEAFTEPGAGGALGVLPSLSWHESILRTTETGGSSSGGWRYVFDLAFSGEGFAFSRSTIKRENRNTGSFFKRETDYETLLTTKTLKKNTTKDPARVKYYNLISSKIAANAITHDPVGSDAWSEAQPITLSADCFIVFDKEHYGGNTDLSATVRTLWTRQALHFHVTVTDECAVFQPDETISVRHDHVEIWFDGGHEQEDYIPRSEPDSQLTTQMSFSPLEGSSDLVCYLLYPGEKQIHDARGTCTRLSNGYIIEVSVPSNYLPFVEEPFMFTQSVKYLNCTLIVSDSDNAASPAQEAMLATSQFRWGSPFSMGKLLLFEKYSRPSFPDYGF